MHRARREPFLRPTVADEPDQRQALDGTHDATVATHIGQRGGIAMQPQVLGQRADDAVLRHEAACDMIVAVHQRAEAYGQVNVVLPQIAGGVDDVTELLGKAARTVPACIGGMVSLKPQAAANHAPVRVLRQGA